MRARYRNNLCPRRKSECSPVLGSLTDLVCELAQLSIKTCTQAITLDFQELQLLCNPGLKILIIINIVFVVFCHTQKYSPLLLFIILYLQKIFILSRIKLQLQVREDFCILLLQLILLFLHFMFLQFSQFLKSFMVLCN